MSGLMFGLLSCAVVLAGDSPAATTIVDLSDTDLLRAYPQLSHIRLDADANRLAPLLTSTGKALGKMYGRFVDCSAAMEIHEMRLQPHQRPAGDQRESALYTARIEVPDATIPVSEWRALPGQSAPAEKTNFLWLLDNLLPSFQAMSRFRLIGEDAGGAMVIAFAQRPESAQLTFQLAPGESGKAFLQGLVWIDPATSRILRVRSSLLARPPASEARDLIMDIRFTTVHFDHDDTTLWLPALATVDARLSEPELYYVYRFHDYRLADQKQGPGITSDQISKQPDARETEFAALNLMNEQNWAGAIKNLQGALVLDSAVPDAHYYLGIALWKSGDHAHAEPELREAVRDDPPFADAHYSLAMALEHNGDRRDAAAELKQAVSLAPRNETFQNAYRSLAAASPPSLAKEPADTIRVNVRQVLVPVVVTDRDGHYITDLKQADFRVFEDGVEQVITSFRVEQTGSATEVVEAANPAIPTDRAQESPRQAAAKPPGSTWLICMDTLHSGFANFARVRKALSALFGEERADGSQYALVALGRDIKVIQNSTRDPDVILSAIGAKTFQSAILASEKSSRGGDMADFRRHLDETVNACTSGDPSCLMRKQALPLEADRLAEKDRLFDRSFLDQLRALASQLAHAPGRRTIVLLSDGFDLVPGREGYSLLGAAFHMLPNVFPEFRTYELRTAEPMRPEFDAVVRAADRDDVAIYTIDSRGLYTQAFYDASNAGSSPQLMPTVERSMDDAQTEAGDTLAELAAATGGTFFHNNNDLLKGLRRAFADGREYYMLAYSPKNAAVDGKFRTIRVEVRDRKAVVRAKRGYWASTATGL